MLNNECFWTGAVSEMCKLAKKKKKAGRSWLGIPKGRTAATISAALPLPIPLQGVPSGMAAKKGRGARTGLASAIGGLVPMVAAMNYGPRAAALAGLSGSALGAYLAHGKD